MPKNSGTFYRPCASIFLCVLLSCSFIHSSFSQNYEIKSVCYNTLIGAFSGGIGALINKQKNQSWHRAFAKGFLTGSAGGVLMYTGKKLSFLLADQEKLFYGRLPRAVFSAGNSIVENAACNRPFWSRWHYDVGFIRLEFGTEGPGFIPRLMPSALGGMIFIAFHGELDLNTTLRSGTFTFRTPHINYAGHLVGSTTSNGFLLVDTLTSSKTFYEIFAHEMIHTFQFQEFSGVNYFMKPVTDKWKSKYPLFKKVNRWIYWDLNYELMLTNYFIIQGGYGSRTYCRNFLENEAEVLSTGRISCPR